MKIILKYIIIAVAMLPYLEFSYADTLYLESGNEIKGIIVEEYRDRVVISTYDGEKTVRKNDIENITFDLAEQNMVRMGDALLLKKEYLKAYSFYSRALKINPEYKPAKEKLDYVMGYVFRKKEMDKLDDVKRVQENTEGRQSDDPENSVDRELEKYLGAVLAEMDGVIKVTKVLKNSPAYHGGLRQGDVIISVWGRLAGYMTKKDIARMLLMESPGEIRLGIEREIAINKGASRGSYRSIMGVSLNVLFNGLTIVDIDKNGLGMQAGLMSQDLIHKINGQPTRYMPFSDARKMLEARRNKIITLTVRREVTIWRG